jgi:hypothetical protein
MSGFFAGEGLVMLAFFRNPGSLTPETPEIVELGPAHAAPTNHLYALHGGGVEGENTFYANAGRNFPDGKGLTHTAAFASNANTLEGLDSLFFALTDAIENPDRIPGIELGKVLAKLLLDNLTQQI